MSKAETVTCRLCGDTGTVHFKGGDEDCAACHARMVLDTGVRTTGEVVHPVAEDDLDSDDIFVHPVRPKSVSRVFVSAERVDELDATIAEQAAEIERLKNSLHQQMQWADNAAARKVGTDDAVLADAQEIRNRVEQVSQERDALRLEVQRLNRELDAERATSDTMSGDGQQASVDLAVLRNEYAALEAERDALQIRVQNLVDHSKLLESRLDAQTKYSAEANARAEKYKAVIEATNANAATMVNVLIAMADAGMSMPPYLPCDLERKSGDD